MGILDKLFNKKVENEDSLEVLLDKKTDEEKEMADIDEAERILAKEHEK